MRLYTFVNMYLSHIQKGIQTAHVVHELFNEWVGNPQELLLHEWSTRHKTIIVLNGSDCESLSEFYNFLQTSDTHFPFAKFCEDEASLGGALTCVGIVLPERIYNSVSASKNPNSYWSLFGEMYNLMVPSEPRTGAKFEVFATMTNWERDLVERLKGYKLA